MRTVTPIKLLVGTIMATVVVLIATAMAMGVTTERTVTMLTVTNETPYLVEVRVEGSTMCYAFELYGGEASTPMAVEHEGVVMVGGFARGEFGGLIGYWPMTEYRPPRMSGTSELLVKLTEAEMMPPD